MALQLPQQPNDPRVGLPQAPANPPALADVYRAVRLKQSVLESATSNDVNASTQDDVSRAVVYEHSVAHVVAAGIIGPAVAPPWFAPVQQQLSRMEASLATLKNAGNGDGNIYPFTIVPFNDGTDPTAGPHNLPPLTSTSDINTLSAANCNRYLNGYGVPHAPGHANVAERRRLVKIAIGCRSL